MGAQCRLRGSPWTSLETGLDVALERCHRRAMRNHLAGQQIHRANPDACLHTVDFEPSSRILGARLPISLRVDWRVRLVLESCQRMTNVPAIKRSLATFSRSGGPGFIDPTIVKRARRAGASEFRPAGVSQPQKIIYGGCRLDRGPKLLKLNFGGGPFRRACLILRVERNPSYVQPRIKGTRHGWGLAGGCFERT